jgi:hypothetical protein
MAEPKTELIGYVPIAKLGKSWGAYKEKADAFSTAKTESEDAKEVLRTFIKQKLRETGDLDFTPEGDRIRVFKVLQKKEGRRVKGKDLSGSF